MQKEKEKKFSVEELEIVELPEREAMIKVKIKFGSFRLFNNL